MDRNRLKSKLSQKILFAGSIGAILGCVIYLIMIVNAGVKSMLLPFRFFDFNLSFGDSSNLLDGLFNMADSIGSGVNSLMGEITSYLSAIISIRIGIILFGIFFAIFIAALIYNAVKLNNKRIKINSLYNIMFAIGSVSAIISLISLAKLVRFSSFIGSIQYERIINFSSYPPGIDTNYLASIINMANTLGLTGFNPSFGIIMLNITIICFSIGAYSVYKIGFGKKKAARPKMQSPQRSTNRPAPVKKLKQKSVEVNNEDLRADRQGTPKTRKRPPIESEELGEEEISVRPQRPSAPKMRKRPAVETDTPREASNRKKKPVINEENTEDLEVYYDYAADTEAYDDYADDAYKDDYTDDAYNDDAYSNDYADDAYNDEYDEHDDYDDDYDEDR